jgi:putative phage-type endonuclease
MLTLQIDQQTEEWFNARLGIPTASGFDKLVTSKGEPSKQSQKYLWKLAGERVSGRSEETFQNGAMMRGVELEAEAREFYELTHDVTVDRVGLVYPDEDKKFACSPDGLVGEDGCLEIKCPSVSTHVGYLLDNRLPVEYVQQVQGTLLITGRDWLDFLSYYPGLKPLLVRVTRDEAFIGKLKESLALFCNELEEVVQKIS